MGCNEMNLCNDSIKLKFDGNHKNKATCHQISVNSETITKGFSNTVICDYSTKSYTLNKMVSNLLYF